MDRRNMIGLGLAAAALPKQALADTLMPGDGSVPSDPKEIVTLWPGTPPGGAGVRLPNRIQNRDPGAAPVDRYIDQVGNPSMIVFRPDRPDGSAFIVAPGGGYSREMMDFEGTDVARRFNAAGVTVFVLRYRLPGEGWAEPQRRAAAGCPARHAAGARQCRQIWRSIRRASVSWAFRPAAMSPAPSPRASPPRSMRRWMPPIAVDARPSFSVPMYPVVTMGEGRHAGSRDKLLGENPSAGADRRLFLREAHSRRCAADLDVPGRRRQCRAADPERAWPISPPCAPPISPPRSMSSRPAAMAMASARRWASRMRPGPICCCTGAPATGSSKAV